MDMSRGDEVAWINGHFDAMLSQDTPELRTQYVFDHPILLSGSAMQLIAGSRKKPEETAAVLFLENGRSHFSNSPEAFPSKRGPWEGIRAALRDGSIGFDEALAKAKAPACANLLSYTYVRCITLAWLEELENDVTFAAQLAELALESVLAMTLPSLAVDVRRAVTEGYIRLIHGVLMRRPDGRLFARAFAEGQWAIEDARALGRAALEGQYLHSLGTLALDAYGANLGPTDDYPERIAAWLGKASEPMPPAAEGLDLACKCLSAAMRLRGPGRDSGRTAKALLEAEVYRARASRSAVDAMTIAALAEHAFANLDAGQDAADIDRAAKLLEKFGPASIDAT